jgi:hypothetical protein
MIATIHKHLGDKAEYLIRSSISPGRRDDPARTQFPLMTDVSISIG